MTSIIVNYQPFALNSTATIVKDNNQHQVPLPNNHLINSLYAYCCSENVKDVYFTNCPDVFLEKFQEDIAAEETSQNGLVGEFDKITIRRFENEVSN